MFRYSPSGLLKDRYLRADTLGLAVIEGAAVFDGAEWLEAAAVVIERGTITQLGSAKAIRPPSDARRISLDGAWLVPGLVDVRAYAVGRAPDALARPQSARFRDSGPILLHRAVRDANAMLAAGITVLAQLGEADAEHAQGLRDAVRTGLIAAPTVRYAHPVSPVGGGVEGWAEPGVDPSKRLPGTGMLPRPSRHSAAVASTADGFRKAVRRAFVDGADMIVLLLTGLDPSERMAVTDDELAAVADEVQRVGASIACVATGHRPAKAAVAAGVDLLVAGPPEPDDELVELLGRARTAWAPSLAARGSVGPALREAVRAVSERGGRVVVGSGWTPERPVPFAAEVQALLDCGLGPAAVLRAATADGARALALAGRIAPGLPADLVALERDPRSAPTALGAADSARLVVHSVPGRRLTPLQQILAVPGAR